MATTTAAPTLLDSKLKRSPAKLGVVVFGLALAVGVVYAGSHLISDLQGVRTSAVYPFLVLGVAAA